MVVREIAIDLFQFVRARLELGEQVVLSLLELSRIANGLLKIDHANLGWSWAGAWAAATEVDASAAAHTAKAEKIRKRSIVPK